MENNNIHPLRIEAIKNISIPFPLFIEDNDTEDINQAVYITNIVGFNPLLLPQTIVITRETGNGIITNGVYQLVQATKAPTNVNIQDN